MAWHCPSTSWQGLGVLGIIPRSDSKFERVPLELTLARKVKVYGCRKRTRRKRKAGPSGKKTAGPPSTVLYHGHPCPSFWAGPEFTLRLDSKRRAGPSGGIGARSEMVALVKGGGIGRRVAGWGHHVTPGGRGFGRSSEAAKCLLTGPVKSP